MRAVYDRKRLPTEADLLFLCSHADQVERLALFVSYLKLPFLARPEAAIEILKQLSGYEGRLMPSGVRVRQVHALGITSLALMMDVEKVSRH